LKVFQNNEKELKNYKKSYIYCFLGLEKRFYSVFNLEVLLYRILKSFMSMNKNLTVSSIVTIKTT
jgi:hypothetical protein